ncbi:MAG: NifU family protein [Pseudomonadota bacterium]
MFIQTEETPNPNAIKFLPGTSINHDDPIFITEADDCNSSLARKLFSLEGIEGIFFGSDFITITKSDSAYWDAMKPQIIMVVMDHLLAGLPVFDNMERRSVDIDPSTLNDIELEILEIIETKVRPSVAMDGGDIVYKGFEGGVVLVELRGACSGCPSSTLTLKKGIESMLQHYVPSVRAVEAIN